MRDRYTIRNMPCEAVDILRELAIQERRQHGVIIEDALVLYWEQGYASDDTEECPDDSTHDWT